MTTVRNGWVYGGGAVALALICGAYLAWPGAVAPTSDQARLACEGGVKGKVASADISDVTVTSSGRTFTVVGTVYSDDALGEPASRRFTCRAVLRGAVWELRITGLTG